MLTLTTIHAPRRKRTPLSPITREPLDGTVLTNYALKQMLEQHSDYVDGFVAVFEAKVAATVQTRLEATATATVESMASTSADEVYDRTARRQRIA